MFTSNLSIGWFFPLVLFYLIKFDTNNSLPNVVVLTLLADTNNSLPNVVVLTLLAHLTHMVLSGLVVINKTVHE